MPKKSKQELRDKEWLVKQYVKNLRSADDIAIELECSKHSVLRALKKFDVPIRKRTSKYAKLNDKEWLRKTYVDDGKSIKAIAEMIGTAPGNIRSALISIGIKPRGIKESLRAKYPDGRHGEQAANWQGGKREQDGYIYIYAPDHPFANNGGGKYIQEHRLVMEKVLGRYLRPDEVVHHKDGNRQNNHPDNLVVKTRGKHVSEHFKASHEVLQMRQRVAELEAENARLKAELEKCENG